MTYQFYTNHSLLFTLEDAAEYDTATPYQYAVGRLVQLDERIEQGQPVTVISRTDQGVVIVRRTAVLQTGDQLRSWIAEHFTGFDRFMP